MPSKVRILDPPRQQERPLTSSETVRGRSSSSPVASGAVWWSTGCSALYGPTFERSLIEDHVICSVKVAGVGITVSVPAVMGSAVLLGLLVSPMNMVWAARAASMSVTESPTNVAAAGGPGAGEVVCCGGGVGCGDGFDFVGGEGGVDVPGSGFQRGGQLPSGNPLAGCGRVDLLQQRQLRSRGVELLGYNRGAHPHRGDRLPGRLLVTVGTGPGSPRHPRPRGSEAARSSVCSRPRRSRGSGRCLWSGIQIAPFRPPIVTGLDLNRPHRR
jgi:hypothetical protein